MSPGLVRLALQASLALVVLGAALHARPGDLPYLARHRALLGRSVLSVNVLMPLLALGAAVVLSLEPPVELALIALAVSPIPPFLPLSAKRAGGKESYTIGLLAAESVLAIVLVPVTIWLIGTLFGRTLYVPPGVIARILITGIVLPIIAGAVCHYYFPKFAERIARPVTIAAMVLLAVGFIPLLIAFRRPVLSLIGNGTIVAIIALVLIGLWIGHVLGGPSERDRPVLALATATRHPAVAITILSTTFPDEKSAPAAVVLALLVTVATVVPYTNWAKHRLEPAPKPILITPSTTRRRTPRSGSAPPHPSAPMPARRRGERRP